MDADRWNRLNELFHAALERAPQERGAFLAAACGSDEALLEEAKRLVRANDHAEARVGTTVFERAAGGLVPFDEPHVVGRLLGPYRIVRELGRGGMGTVYEAERADLVYEKRVAIKLVKRGMDTDAVLRQFLHERQILATLEHPNIARMLDGGTTDDHLPYFVMEYVEGRPIDEYCEAHALPLDDRLRLFRLVCGAVVYAHQHLVVHRDIKPTNILVAPDGTPKLLDFGIAKIMQPGGALETGSTVAALRLMTPDYASPEQIQGLSATTLSDVYSLGVVLYEMVAGRRPYRFDSHALPEVANTILTSNPALPSDAAAGRPDAARLRGDLDNIVLKAMSKERDRRYQSAEQLAEDIGRHLNGQPVTARKDTLGYRTAKFVRRHRVAVAAGAVAALALVAATAGMAWLAHKARVQEGIAKAEQARAERRFNDVRQLARAVVFDYHDAIRNLPGSAPVRARLVRDALTYLDSLAKEAQTDRSLQRELASAYERVGDVQGGTMDITLGDTSGALASYRKALEIREGLAASDPKDSEGRRDLAVAYRRLGALLWETGDMAGALASNRKSLELCEVLARESPSDATIRLELARAHDHVGRVLQETGKSAEGLDQFERSRDICEALLTANPREPNVRRALSVALEQIAIVRQQAGNLEAALDGHGKALELRTALAAEFPLNADYKRTVAVSRLNYAEVLDNLGRTREALELYRKALAVAEADLAAAPNNAEYRGGVGYSLLRIGDMLATLGRHREALPAYQRSLALGEADAKADPGSLWRRGSLVEVHAKIARTLAKTGQRPAARAACAETLALIDATTIEPTNAYIRTHFAVMLAELGATQAALASSGSSVAESRDRWREAQKLYQRSLDELEDLDGRGTLASVDRPRMQKLADEIARCDRALAATSTPPR